MTTLAGCFDGGGKLGFVVVTVAEHEVGRPGGEKFDDFGGTNVAAVENGVDAEAFEESHRGTGELDAAVGVANDAESHDGASLP
jgi:hypothetical protein